jgi:hypothetical protein
VNGHLSFDRHPDRLNGIRHVQRRHAGIKKQSQPQLLSGPRQRGVVIVPAYNEAAVIKRTLPRMIAIMSFGVVAPASVALQRSPRNRIGRQDRNQEAEKPE